MLLSQRVAQDAMFLERVNKKYKGSFKQTTLFDIRMMIIDAVKFIVGPELLQIDGFGTDKLKLVWELMGYSKESFDTKSNDDFCQAMIKRSELYSEFSRLPYPLMVLENKHGLLLLQQDPQDPKCFRHLCIDSRGLLIPAWVHSNITRLVYHPDGIAIPLGMTQNTYDGQDIGTRYDDTDPMKLEVFKVITINTQLAMECLLYINVSNNHIPVLLPNKRDMKAVPTALLPKYSYRIVDIFRERKEYLCMADVDVLWDRKENDIINRRAHMVRGHFKRKNGKLFWWNPFMRNRKNLETHGAVDHDYQVK